MVSVLEAVLRRSLFSSSCCRCKGTAGGVEGTITPAISAVHWRRRGASESLAHDGSVSVLAKRWPRPPSTAGIAGNRSAPPPSPYTNGDDPLLALPPLPRAWELLYLGPWDWARLKEVGVPAGEDGKESASLSTRRGCELLGSGRGDPAAASGMLRTSSVACPERGGRALAEGAPNGGGLRWLW